MATVSTPHNYYVYNRRMPRVYSFKDKAASVDDMVSYMLARTCRMFKYEGLPDTIPAYILELLVQSNGAAIIAKHEGNLYVFLGGWGGELNEYYLPTKYTVANPYLKFDKTFTIGDDCVLANNDSAYRGLLPLLSKYATIMAENELTLKMTLTTLRTQVAIAAPDNRSRISADLFVKGLEDGDLRIIADNTFLDGVRTLQISTSSQNVLTQLIEVEQYAKASLYNELGLNANYNMKRESINSGEAQLNNDALTPLIDDMLASREAWVAKVNEMFGTEISVSFNSAWEDNELELEAVQDMLNTEPETEPESEIESEPEPETESELESGPESEAEPEVEPELEPEPEPEPLVDVLEDIAQSLEDVADEITEADDDETERS